MRTQDEATLPAGELQRRAMAGSLWTGIHTIVYLPIAFAANAIIARILGVVDYGHLAFLTAILSLAIPFASFGFVPALIQRGSRAEAAGRRKEADDLLQRSLGFHLTVALPILVLIVVALTWNGPAWETIALVCAVVLICVFSGPSLSLTIENRTAVAAQISIGLNLIVQAAAVAAAVIAASASSVWAVRALVPALALGLNVALLNRVRRRATLRPLLPRGLGSSYWRFALLTWVGSIVSLLVFSRSEIFILQALDQPEALGVFALAFGLSQQLTAPADALIHPLLPAVAGILSTWPDRAKDAFDRITRLSSVICGGLAAAVVPTLVFATPVIYGDEFAEAAWLLLPLALVSIYRSVNNSVSAFVSAREQAGIRLKAYTVALLVDVLVAITLIPRFGAWGAVVAAVVAQLIAIGWLAAAEPMLRGKGALEMIRLQRAFIVGLAAAGMALGGGLAIQQWSESIAVLGTFCIGTTSYILGVHLSRSQIPARDRDALLSALPTRLQRSAARFLRPLTSNRSEHGVLDARG